MSGKNPELCERPYCRARWTHQVHGYHEHQKRSWDLRLCADHAQEYNGPHDGCVGAKVTVAKRFAEK